MKRRYERPSAYIEEFTPNEYVAACGDKGTTYKFKCTAGEGIKGDLTDEAGSINYTYGKRSYYQACNAVHEASSDDTFVKGRYYPNNGNDKFNGSFQYVYLWFEPRGKDFWGQEKYSIHATTDLNKDNWETAKS